MMNSTFNQNILKSNVTLSSSCQAHQEIDIWKTKEKKTMVLERSSQIPDFNHMDMLWQDLKRAVYKDIVPKW